MAADAAAATITIPTYLWAGIGVLGTIVFTWMLGLFGRLLGGNKTANGRGDANCENCAQTAALKADVTAIKTDVGSLRVGQDALNGRIDQLFIALGVGNGRGQS